MEMYALGVVHINYCFAWTWSKRARGDPCVSAATDRRCHCSSTVFVTVHWKHQTAAYINDQHSSGVFTLHPMWMSSLHSLLVVVTTRRITDTYVTLYCRRWAIFVCNF